MIKKIASYRGLRASAFSLHGAQRWKKRSAPWRPIETLYLQPSIGLASIAQEKYPAMPGLLRFMLNVLGAKSHSGDLLSFLLFESEFTSEIFELGYKDTIDASLAIEEFFA